MSGSEELYVAVKLNVVVVADERKPYLHHRQLVLFMLAVNDVENRNHSETKLLRVKYSLFVFSRSQ